MSPVSAGDNLSLPVPDADAIAHSARLVERISESIRAADDWLDFAEYMRLALYAPGLGYYAAGAQKFGADGDFVTAPEISPLFGACLARQVERLLAQGCAARVLEFGAGSGRLCRDLLRAAPGLARYAILETSPDLRQRQHDLLRAQLSAELFHKIEWLERLPAGFDGIVLANEVLDAMPVQLLEKTDGWQLLGVGLDGDKFGWRRRPAGDEVLAALQVIEAAQGELPPGYRCEINPHLGPWMRALDEACERVAVLLIDYGYPRELHYHPARTAGTLSCHFRHRVHADPLVYPGLQDITAFVDFDACADAAEVAGFDIGGLATQAQFLLANGLLELAQEAMAGAGDAERITLAQQIKTLTLPGEMGEKFKVLALTKDIEVEFDLVAGIPLG